MDSRDHSPVSLLLAGNPQFLRVLARHFEASERYDFVHENWGASQDRPGLDDDRLSAIDVVFCEWARKEAHYFSHNKAPAQRLMVRLHAYDIDTPHAWDTNWDNVDRLVFVSPEIRDRFCKLHPETLPKSVIIRNVVDVNALQVDQGGRTPWSLGMLQFYDSRKAPHLAVSVLEGLLSRDDRYSLSLKGHHGWQRDHVWNRIEERQYIKEVYDHLQSIPAGDAVTVCRFTKEVVDWFSSTGIILSTSRDEGSHHAIAEAMAAGVVPVVRGWPGSDWQYPDAVVMPFDEEEFVEAAVAFVLGLKEPGRLEYLSGECRRFAEKNFAEDVVLPQYDRLIQEIVTESESSAEIKRPASRGEPVVQAEATDKVAAISRDQIARHAQNMLRLKPPADVTSIDAVLPLAKKDWERFERLQLPTLHHYFQPLGTLWIVVPDADLVEARGKFEDTQTVVLPDSCLIPPLNPVYRSGLGSAAGPPAGWYVQQLVKLAMARHVRTKFYLCLDADNLFVRNIEMDDLVQEEKAILVVRGRRLGGHAEWYRQGARLLDLPESHLSVGVTPVVLAVPAVYQLFAYLELRHGTSAERYLYEHFPWTEYATYVTMLSHFDFLNDHHIQVSGGLSGRNVWHESDWADWKAAENFGKQKSHFISVLQSHSVHDIDDVVTRIRTYFTGLGEQSPV